MAAQRLLVALPQEFLMTVPKGGWSAVRKALELDRFLELTYDCLKDNCVVVPEDLEGFKLPFGSNDGFAITYLVFFVRYVFMYQRYKTIEEYRSETPEIKIPEGDRVFLSKLVQSIFRRGVLPKDVRRGPSVAGVAFTTDKDDDRAPDEKGNGTVPKDVSVAGVASTTDKDDNGAPDENGNGADHGEDEG